MLAAQEIKVFLNVRTKLTDGSETHTVLELQNVRMKLWGGDTRHPTADSFYCTQHVELSGVIVSKREIDAASR